MLKLVMIGALGTMLGPSATHLLNATEVRVLRVLDRGTAGEQRAMYRRNWQNYGTELVNSIDALITANDFDILVICAGKNGDDQQLFQDIVPRLTPHTLILHLSTVSCSFVTITEKFCQHYQIDYVNYPLTGGAAGAANASMLILAGGSEKIYQRIEPLLQQLGKPRYFGSATESGAVTKFVSHTLVFNGLISIISAITLQARCSNITDFSATQVALFDFLNQGAGGTRQWDVALKNGLQANDWQKGFLLKHAAIDLIYLLQLMIQKKQFPASLAGLFELAYSFVYLLQLGLETAATQMLAPYWLDPEKVCGLNKFLTEFLEVALEPTAKLMRCVDLFPEALKKNILLEVAYTHENHFA